MHYPIHLDLPHRVHFTRGAFAPGQPLLAEILAADPASPGRVMVVVDHGFLASRPAIQREIEAYFATHARHLPPLAGFRPMPGGEQCKNDLSHLEWLLAEMNRLRLCRQSVVLAIGGGAVLDVAGFAAAVCHRGIPLLRMPTTTLAQGDSGVGIKNAVNMFGKKNFVGAFAVPKAVIADLDFLSGLPDREFLAGFSECVKVALLKDPAFFRRLEVDAPAVVRRDPAATGHAMSTSARLHMEHIALGGDPFEQKSARPLDFGHWAAHKLEQMTGFTLSHGEAVALGVALDLTWGELAGLVSPATAARAIRLLRALGLPVYHPAMADAATLLEGLDEFREHLGGRLTLTLPIRPGQCIQVHEVSKARVMEAVSQLATKAVLPPSETKAENKFDSSRFTP